MQSNAITRSIGGACLSRFEPMLCHAVLGKLPFVLKPFTNFTIDDSSDTAAELIQIAENKLSAIHNCLLARWHHDEKLPRETSPVPVPSLQKIYRIYLNIWMPVTAGAVEFQQESSGKRVG